MAIKHQAHLFLDIVIIDWVDYLSIYSLNTDNIQYNTQYMLKTVFSLLWLHSAKLIDIHLPLGKCNAYLRKCLKGFQ